jgi:transposase
MDETTLYAEILQIEPPWFVEDVQLDKAKNSVEVFVTVGDVSLCCPLCDKPSPGYDHRERRWRHLDTCQFQTYVTAQVPRVNCSDHGCLTIDVSWAEQKSRFTLLFETLVISWLQTASILAVSKQLSLSWNAVDGIMKRAVARGIARRGVQSFKQIGVDETCFKKGHDYVTVISNQAGHVLAVEDDRKKSSLKRFYDSLSEQEKSGIESISMDMCQAYIYCTLEEIPDAKRKIAFDKFHVAQSLNQAVDEVRKDERKKLTQESRDHLKGSRFLWLRNGSNLDREQNKTLNELQSIAVKTAKAWSIKEYAMSLWDYQVRGWAEKGWGIGISGPLEASWDR